MRVLPLKWFQIHLQPAFLTATALRQQGKNFESEIQFRRALDVADTDAERQMARQSMRIVENTKKWSGNLTLGIAPHDKRGQSVIGPASGHCV